MAMKKKTMTEAMAMKKKMMTEESAAMAKEEKVPLPLVEGLEFLQLLGEGGFGRVWKAKRKSRGGGGNNNPASSLEQQQQLIAVKMMSKPMVNTSAAAALQREVEIWHFLCQSASSMSLLTMPVVQMLGQHATSDGTQVCISMQLCSGGTLAPVLPLRDESKVMALAHTLAQGLHFCHSLGVLHLDLKPENVLFPSLASRDACRGALLADFGLSQFLPRGSDFLVKSAGAGTCGYQAPEVITHGIYSPAADAWSLGALLLESITGHLPPHDTFCDPDGLIYEFEQWQSCDSLEPSWVDDYMEDVWDCPSWATSSTAAKDAIRGLLCPNPRLRLTPLQLLDHPWLKDEQMWHMAAPMHALRHVPLRPPPGFA